MGQNSNVGVVSNKQNYKDSLKVDWLIINPFEQIFFYLRFLEENGIENTIPGIPANPSDLINKITEKLYESNIPQLKGVDSNEILNGIKEKESLRNFLKTKYRINNFYTLQKIIIEVFAENYDIPISIDKPEFYNNNKVIKEKLKETMELGWEAQKTISKDIIDSDIDSFRENLNMLLENQLKGDYYLIDNSIKDLEGNDSKATIYIGENTKCSLKIWSPSLISAIAGVIGYKKKPELIYPSDLVKIEDVDLNKYANIAKPKKLEINIRTLEQNLYSHEEYSKIIQLEQLENTQNDEVLESYQLEYKQVSSILGKYYFDLANSSEKSLYLKLNNSDFFEDEKILYSFERELNSGLNIDKLIMMKEKIDSEKSLFKKDNLKDQKEKDKLENYFKFVLIMLLNQTLHNRISITEAIKSLNSDNETDKDIKKLILKHTKKGKFVSYHLNPLLEELSKFKEEEIKNEKIKKIFKYINNNKNDVDVSKYSYFFDKTTMAQLVSDSYKREIVDNISELLRKFKLNEGSIDFLSLKNNRRLEIPKTLESYFNKYLNVQNMLIFSKDENIVYPYENELNTLDLMEKEINDKSNEGSFSYIDKDKLTYIAISRIILLLTHIQNKEEDFSLFDKYFINTNQRNNTIIDIVNYLKERKKLLKINFPIDFNKLFYQMGDDFRNIVVQYMKNNHIDFNPENKFVLNISEKLNNFAENSSLLLEDYLKLKEFYLKNYNDIDEQIIYFVEKNGFQQFFIDFSSLENPSLDILKETLPEDSFLLKSSIEKLKIMEDHLGLNKAKMLNYNSVLIDLKILQFIKSIDVYLNNPEELDSIEEFFYSNDIFEDFKKKLKKLSENKNFIKNVTNSLNRFKEKDLLFSKYSRINFFNKDLKEVLSKNIHEGINPTFKEIENIDVISLPLLPKIKIESNANKTSLKVASFMDYSYEELKEEDNIILKTRTRMAQMAYLTLKIASDLTMGVFSTSNYINYFKNEEELNSFKNLVKNDILVKTKEGFDVNSKQIELRKFLRSNHINLKDIISSYQGYVPSGKAGEFIIEDLTQLVGEKNRYQLDMIGLVKKNKLSYEKSILTPSIIIHEKNDINKGGMVTGYNLRVTTKKELDKEKLENILLFYYRGKQSLYMKNVGSNTNAFDEKHLRSPYVFSNYIKNLSVDILEEKVNFINKKLKELNKKLENFKNKDLKNEMIFILEYTTTPKEPATSKNINGTADLKEASLEISKVPTMFANFAKMNEVDLEQPITIHFNEGAKDSMSLSSILPYSSNKNQLAIPLQGTQGFKSEFSDILFNIPNNQKVILKVWADLDYAGLTLLHHLKEITDEYPNVELVSMQDLTFDTLFKDKLENNDYTDIKGADLTDWSVEMRKEFNVNKSEQSTKIDNFNEKFSYSSKAYKTIALKHLETKIEKLKLREDFDPQKLDIEIEKELANIGLNREDLPELKVKSLSTYEQQNIAEQLINQ